MNKWEKLIEDGQEFWVNDELGNIVKVGNEYIALIPKILKVRTFQ